MSHIKKNAWNENTHLYLQSAEVCKSGFRFLDLWRGPSFDPECSHIESDTWGKTLKREQRFQNVETFTIVKRTYNSFVFIFYSIYFFFKASVVVAACAKLAQHVAHHMLQDTTGRDSPPRAHRISNRTRTRLPGNGSKSSASPSSSESARRYLRRWILTTAAHLSVHRTKWSKWLNAPCRNQELLSAGMLVFIILADNCTALNQKSQFWFYT